MHPVDEDFSPISEGADDSATSGRRRQKAFPANSQITFRQLASLCGPTTIEYCKGTGFRGQVLTVSATSCGLPDIRQPLMTRAARMVALEENPPKRADSRIRGTVDPAIVRRKGEVPLYNCISSIHGRVSRPDSPWALWPPPSGILIDRRRTVPKGNMPPGCHGAARMRAMLHLSTDSSS
jgi:hypothetical protein